MGKPNRPDYTILTLTDVRALNSVISRFSRHTRPIAGQLTRHYNFWIITVFPKCCPRAGIGHNTLAWQLSVGFVIASFSAGYKSVKKKHQRFGSSNTKPDFKGPPQCKLDARIRKSTHMSVRF